MSFLPALMAEAQSQSLVVHNVTAGIYVEDPHSSTCGYDEDNSQ
jgi:hypothetical protein